MSEDYISRSEHEEFAKRIDDHNERQDARLKEIEKSVTSITELVTSVKELAVEMKHMSEEQRKQGQRLETLEGRDGEKWRTVVACMITAVVGAVIGIVADGFFLAMP